MKGNGRKRRAAIRKRQAFLVRLSFCIFLMICLFIGMYMASVYYRESRISYALTYEKSVYDSPVYVAEGFSTPLCVTGNNQVSMANFEDNDKLSGAALFSLTDKQVRYAYHLFDRIYPASTTKLMTALLVLKTGQLDDLVTVGDEVSHFGWDEQVAGLQMGDQLTVRDLLCALLIYSGNDAASALAVHISGSEADFVQAMNKEARALGATGTHYVNAHGLHDPDHYTTVYDLYLVMNACLQYDAFSEIIGLDTYTANITAKDGQTRQLTWKPTNYYKAGLHPVPPNVHVVGGKTGTTDEAGSCLVLYAKDVTEKPYIAIVTGAPEKLTLYDEISSLMARGMPEGQNQ